MNLRILLFAILFSSCTAVKVSIPEKFRGQSTKFQVNGINGWMINQKLSFGPYQTSSVKRGWDFQGSIQYTKFKVSPEEMLLRVFDINTDKRNLNQRNKFQFTIQDGELLAEIYATEKFLEKQLVYKSNNPFIGDISRTNSYKYAFTASILPLSEKTDPWSLVLINRYDVSKDTARRLSNRPQIEEEGYATNGKDNISIRPLRTEKVTTKADKQIKIFGGEILTGYEILWDGDLVAIIDILDNSVWFYNDLEPSKKLLLSSISSAIFLKRLQDVAKDKDNI